MKKVFSFALAVVMVLGLFTACSGSEAPATAATEATEAPVETTAGTEAPAETEAETEAAAALTTVEPGKLIMSTNAAFPPFEMVADDGSFEGYDVEVAAAIAEKLGLELQIDDMDFDAALLAVQQGKSDIVMAGVSVTEDRLLVMNFSDYYFSSSQKVIVKEGSDVTLDNLGEKMCGAQRATTGYIYVSDTYGEDHVTAYDNGASAVQALLNDQVDCVVIDASPAQEFVDGNPGLVLLDGYLAEDNYAIGVGKENTALLDAINQALVDLNNDGTIPAIYDKYFGE